MIFVAKIIAKGIISCELVRVEIFWLEVQFINFSNIAITVNKMIPRHKSFCSNRSN